MDIERTSKRGRAALLTRQVLMNVKSRARRSGIWYEALSRAERAIVDLTIKCVEKVRSPILARTITKIIGKVVKTLEQDFMAKAQEIGTDIAKRIVGIAQKWGNKKSSGWLDDTNFITFLGAIRLNA